MKDNPTTHHNPEGAEVKVYTVFKGFSTRCKFVDVKKKNYFCILTNFSDIMAMTINSSPVLTGESARLFVEEAEKNAQLPTPKLSPEREAELREMDRKSKEFISFINSNG